ncbi:DUF2726 domain-containing protein [Paraburkholderia sediminicola]|uniref:DUF2726 domain-containing protein n=1 Tax=Paraburkholderia metrosideri TaxID=580937 RepID=A0ABW9DQY8_9BURK
MSRHLSFEGVMNPVWIIVIGVALIGLCGALFVQAKRRAGGPVDYLLRPLLTARETAFLADLWAALPEAVIHVQVAMSALIEVKGGNRAARNKLDRKVFDFAVCSANGDVLYVVELDDCHHSPHSARGRDATKDAIASAAGLRLIRYESGKVDAATLRSDFELILTVRRYAGAPSTRDVQDGALEGRSSDMRSTWL